MTSSKVKTKIKTVNNLIDTIGIRYGTILSYFQRDTTDPRRATLRTAGTYDLIVDVVEEIMINEDHLYRLIEELMTDHINEISGNNVYKIFKKYNKMKIVGMLPFYKMISYRDNLSPEQTSRIYLSGSYQPLVRPIRELVYKLYNTSLKTRKLMDQFKKLTEIKGRGVEESQTEQIPRKFM